jgi:hypothetical protein
MKVLSRNSKDAAKNIDKNVIKKASIKLKTDSSQLPSQGLITEGKESPKKGGLFGESKPTFEPIQKKNSFAAAPELVKDDKAKGMFEPSGKTGLFSDSTKPTEQPASKPSLFGSINEQKIELPKTSQITTSTTVSSMFGNRDSK